MSTSPTTAAASIDVTAEGAAFSFDRHGAHDTASTAPSSMPAARVSVPM